MSTGEFPTSWSDPDYVAAVVGVLAVGAVYGYAELAATGPTVGEVTFVLLATVLPAAAAHELARRIG